MDPRWVRSDGQGFFPPEVGTLVTRLNAFPISRWNFLVVDPSPSHDSAADQKLLDHICDGLKKEFSAPAWTDFQFQCHFTLGSQRDLVEAWARDLPLRKPMPAQGEVLESLNQTLIKASLPLDPALRDLLRHDPFGTYQELLNRLETQKPLKLVMHDDFLVEPTSGKTLIPMLLGNDPLDTGPAERIEAVVNRECRAAKACDQVGLLGGHFATLENKAQVISDLSSVSTSGIGCLVTALLVLLLFRKLRLLFILVPVALGLLMAAATIISRDESIHGLALSFGTGLVGLAVDYGIYTAFHARQPGVWRSNLVGVLTTLVVLGVLSFTRIPVLRQLMQFSILGIAFAFMTIFFLHKLLPRLLVAEPIRLPKLRSRWLIGVTYLAVIAGVIGLPGSHYDLNVQRLNYLTPKTAALFQWFGKLTKPKSLFVIREQNEASGVLNELHDEKSWADQQSIRLESAAAYLPRLADQKTNLQTWLEADCHFRFESSLNDTQRRFFEPYLAQRPCAIPQDLARASPPPYLRHLYGGGGWLSIFLPDNDAQVRAVKKRFPSSFSLMEIAEHFPQVFHAELAWMIPLTLAVTWMVLLIYYRSFVFAAAALLPFFAGVGTVVLLALITGQSFNFVTLIALLMLCGLSTDWGIFAVDGWRRGAPDGRTPSALIFCCFSSTLGVVPLMLAQHPVLKSLGLPLGVGLLGALCGALITVPALLQWQIGRRPHA